MLAAQGVGLGGARLEFALNLQRDRQGHGRHHLDQQGADRRIDDLAGNRLADPSGAAHRGLLTDIDRDGAAMLLAVVHTHALAAQAAQHATLQQRRSFARRSGPPLAAEGAGVVGEPPLVGLEAVPVDVALVHARHDELPFRSGNLDHGGAAVGQVACARAAIDEGAGIARIVQHLQDACVLRWRPQEVALVGPRPQPAREQDALFSEEADGLDRASGPLKGLEHQTDGVLHLRRRDRGRSSRRSGRPDRPAGTSRVHRAAPC